MEWTIFQQSDLADANDRLHDRWFDIDHLEQRGAILAIPISKSASASPRQGEFIWELEIEPVRAYDLKDTERIGMYDLNLLELVEDRQLLRFHFNIPLGLSVRFSGLPLRLSLWTG